LRDSESLTDEGLALPRAVWGRARHHRMATAYVVRPGGLTGIYAPKLGRVETNLRS